MENLEILVAGGTGAAVGLLLSRAKRGAPPKQMPVGVPAPVSPPGTGALPGQTGVGGPREGPTTPVFVPIGPFHQMGELQLAKNRLTETIELNDPRSVHLRTRGIRMPEWALARRAEEITLNEGRWSLGADQVLRWRDVYIELDGRIYYDHLRRTGRTVAITLLNGNPINKTVIGVDRENPNSILALESTVGRAKGVGFAGAFRVRPVTTTRDRAHHIGPLGRNVIMSHSTLTPFINRGDRRVDITYLPSLDIRIEEFVAIHGDPAWHGGRFRFWQRISSRTENVP